MPLCEVNGCNDIADKRVRMGQSEYLMCQRHDKAKASLMREYSHAKVDFNHDWAEKVLAPDAEPTAQPTPSTKGEQ